MRVGNKKLDFRRIAELFSFVGTFFISFFTLIIIFLAAFKSQGKGLQTYFLFSYSSITNILILTTFFMHITKYKDSKVYVWFSFITLINVCITLTESSREMAINTRLFFDREDLYNYFFRLQQIILPFLYLSFYFCIEKNVISKKMLWIVFLFPVLYISALHIFEYFKVIDATGENSYSKLVSREHYNDVWMIALFFNIIQIFFGFLLLTPCVLGVLYLKRETMQNNRIKDFLNYIACFLIIVSLGGFWYPFPFSKQVFAAFTSESFAEEINTHNFNMKHQNIKKQNSSTKSPTSVNSSNNYSISSSVPSIIYKDKYSEFTLDTDEINYIIQNWNAIKNKNLKYEYRSRRYVLNWDSNKQRYFRKRQGFWN